MRKALKGLGIALLSILLVLVLLVLVMMGRHSYYVNKYEKLQSQAGPTAKYLDAMPETNTIYGWAEDLVDLGPRRPGTENGTKAQNYVKEKFEEFGLENVSIIPAQTPLWQCDEWSLTVDGKEVDSYYMSNTMVTGEYGDFSMPKGGATGELVYVGDGEESDFQKVDVKGKIVVANMQFTTIPYALLKADPFYYYDPDNTLKFGDSKMNPYSANTYPYNYYYALENGAVGFIGILSDYFDSNEYNNEDYSYLGTDMSIPGLWVSNKDGEKLIAAAGKSATITMKGSNTEITAGAVVGYLPGKSEETVMVHSHYDSVTPGGAEDASGTVTELAMAKFFADIPEKDRERSLCFISMDSHFSDYDTHDAVIDELFGNETNIVADVCVEHICNEMDVNEDGTYQLNGLVEPRIIFVAGGDALMEITKEEVTRHGLGRSILLPATALGEDVPTDADMFYQTGCPIVSLVSAPIYLYDNIDTVDKVAKDELRPTAECFSDITWRIMGLSLDEIGRSK